MLGLQRYTVVNDMLRDIGRVARDPLHYARRLRARDGLPAPHITIPRDKGFVLDRAENFDGLGPVMDKLRALAQERIGGLDRGHFEALAAQKKLKAFYFNLLTREDLLAAPEVLQFAFNEQILAVLSEYYGMLPELSHIALFYSGLAEPFKEGDTPIGTQKAHIDNHDRRHVKIFVYLEDVGPDDGPLTVLPAADTMAFRRRTGRLLATVPVKNDAEFGPEQDRGAFKAITGPAGTLAFVDTSRCLHYGSRCRDGGSRLTFVLHYTVFADYSYTRTKEYQDLNVATSPELKAIVPHSARNDMLFRLVPVKYE